MAWNGYFHIKISDGLSAEKWVDAKAGIKELGEQTSNNPRIITHLKISTLGKEIIGHITLPVKITKAQVVTKLVNKLGYTEQQILNNIDSWQVFDGADWKERNTNTVAYIVANKSIWGYV